MDAEHAATVKPHAMMAMTRLMMTPPHWRRGAAIPQNATCRIHTPRDPAVREKRNGQPKLWRR
jgi:hypothetical protein